MILFICAAYSFMGSIALAGPAVYMNNFSESFDIDQNKAAGLINSAALGYGLSSLMFVPAWTKFGRRPVMLVSLVLFMGGLLAAAHATTYATFMTARVVHSVGSGVCEALPVQLVNDLFFIHERGQKLGWYMQGLVLGAIGPLIAGYMFAGGYSYHLFFYVVFACGVVLFLLAFFFVEESRYNRGPAPSSTTLGVEIAGTEKRSMSTSYTASPNPPRKSLAAQLKPWSGYDGEAPFFFTIFRSFSYLLVPSTLWAITTYGFNFSLGVLVFLLTFPIKIEGPPYNWSEINSGLFVLGSILGTLLALPLLPMVDRYAASRTRRNGGIREAEMRLGVLLVPMVFGPAGLVLYGLTAEWNLHWAGYFVGYCMVSWSMYFFLTVSLAYAVDSYTANLSELIIVKNVGNQCITFGMGLNMVNWILDNGYGKMIAGVFSVVMLANNIMVLVFMVWGKKIREATHNWHWLANLHRRSVDVTQ